MAIEHWKATPDVITLAKGIASGMPLGATVSWSRLMTWPPGSHASTFGGNPVACAAAIATYDLIKKSLLANVRKVGAFMERELAAMVERHPHLGWVSGRGLMLAVEVVGREGTTEIDDARREAIVQAAFKRGLLLLGAGPSAIRLSPPLVLTQKQAQIGLEILEDAVSEVERRGKRGGSPGKKRARRK
jgi:4-aminobutyrate aminotransferase